MAEASLPLIDMRALQGNDPAARREVASALARACETFGFFYLIGHGVRPETLATLERQSRAFLALPKNEKMEIAMARGGWAWRGYFPTGGELTSGLPDLKEGVYFGTELPPDDPRVQAGWPMHGANLWPSRPTELRPAVETYMEEATRAAVLLMQGVSLALGLDADYFERAYTSDPTILFRIFNYPASAPDDVGTEASWGVGEHTDYGLLTLLAQDDLGGLQVRTPQGWIEAPPIPGALVCNVGDMLERLTGGRFRSAPHRVRNVSGRDRLSFPLFFDPNFAAPMRPLPSTVIEAGRVETDRAQRWDKASVHAFEGTYGDYLLAKVGKVFPDLKV
jgi:isopenicillin N synthase-like dioxygenase